MQVILLEKIHNFGKIGDSIAVKAGFARNYLIPQGKAVVANAANLKKFASMRADLEKKAAEMLVLANARVEKLKMLTVTIPVRTTEEGKLFGSVGNREITAAIQAAGGEVERKEVILATGPIREIGEHEIILQLHADLSFAIKVNIVAESQPS